MRIVLCLAIFALGCSEEKKEPKSEKAADSAAEDKVAADKDRSFALRAPAKSAGKSGDNSGDNLPEDLPDDLKELAEMPPLTAEATPEEINRRIDLSVDALGNFFKIVASSKTCDDLGESLTRFVAVNKRVFQNLQENLKDPKAAKRFSKLMSEQGGRWMASFGPNLSKCATHPKVMGALTELTPRQ